MAQSRNLPYPDTPYRCVSGTCSHYFNKPLDVDLIIGDKDFALEEHTPNLGKDDYQFTTYIFSNEAKAILQDTDSEHVKLRIKISEGKFVTTPIGKKTIKAWQAI